MNTRPLLLLVDGSSYFYRAFHALPPLTNSKGQPTGAIYGVTNMLKRLLKDHVTEHIAVVFDAKGENFRHQIYEQYKAHRPSMPDDLSSQFEPLLQLIDALGLPIIIEPNVEADDVIATLAHKAHREGFDVIISTGDKDLAQLVNDHTILINTMTQTRLDRQGVIEKWGIFPEQVVDYLSLIGDKVDNIPGIPGVGPKTAAQWLKQYQSLENLIQHADEIRGKCGDLLRSSFEQCRLAQQLASLKHDVTLSVSLEDLRLSPLKEDKWIEWLKILEFKSWLKALDNTENDKKKNGIPGSQAHCEPFQSGVYTTILSEEVLTEWLQRLENAEMFVIDTETTSLDALKAQLVGLSFSVKSGEAAYLPFKHHYMGAPVQLNMEYALEKLKPILENPAIKKIGQNLKYDINILKNIGINLQGIAFDTMLESYMQNSSSGRHDMDNLALKHLDYKTLSFEELAGKGTKQLTFDQIDIEKAAFYAAEDADITFKLHECLWPQVSAHEKMANLFHSVEMPLLSILANMEYYGVLVDVKCLQKQSIELGKRLAQLEAEAILLAGEPFNLQSPKQLQAILFEKHQLPVLQKTPKGQPSTAEDVLQELAFAYPLPKLILEHRHLSKLKSTYTDTLPQCINVKTCRVHTSYNQAVTTTGRLSSSQPNLQNIPIRSEEGRKIRQAFIAPAGYQLLSVDYSQIELRLMAHLSQDPGLLSAFSKGLDIHRATAAEVNNISLDEVTGEQRRQAKAVNFGLIYGMSSFGLAKQLGLSREEAQRYINIYFERYPKVQEFMENTRRFARQHSYVETIMGRRMPVPEIHSNNSQRQKAAERAAINAPLQGSAADIIKLAMIHADRWIQESQLGVNLILQVHDELVFEIKNEILNEAKLKIKHIMEHVVSLSVPLEVSIGIGNNWDEAH